LKKMYLNIEHKILYKKNKYYNRQDFKKGYKTLTKKS